MLAPLLRKILTRSSIKCKHYFLYYWHHACIYWLCKQKTPASASTPTGVRIHHSRSRNEIRNFIIRQLGEPASCLLSMVCVLQFLPGTSATQGYARDGGRNCGSRVDYCRFGANVNICGKSVEKVLQLSSDRRNLTIRMGKS